MDCHGTVILHCPGREANLPSLGGPADLRANIRLRENLIKSYRPQTERITISADRNFYTPRSPPTYRSIHDQYLTKIADSGDVTA